MSFPRSLIPCLWLWCLASIGAPRVSMADVTLVYAQAGEGESTGGPTHQIHLRDGRVSIANAADKRLLIFDAEARQAWVVDHREETVTELTREALEGLAATLVETQRQVLAEMEDKLRDLPREEREELRRVMDVLHRSTDPDAGAPPEARRFEVTGKQSEMLGMTVSEARVFVGDQPWGTALLAGPGTAGLPEKERESVRAFGRFFDALAAGLPSSLRHRLGDLAILSPDGRLVTKLSREGGETILELLRLDREPVDPGWFTVPGDFTVVPIIPAENPPGTANKSNANSSEK